MRRKNRKPNKAYLAWIHTQPCICSSVNCQPGIHAHHAGVRGLGQKAPDETAVPLCGFHHLISPLSIHRYGKLFWRFWNLDKEAEIARLQALFIEQERGR